MGLRRWWRGMRRMRFRNLFLVALTNVGIHVVPCCGERSLERWRLREGLADVTSVFLGGKIGQMKKA